MAIPLSLTTISVSRRIPDPVTGDQVDGYAPNPPALQQVETQVRAMITPPSGSARLVGGDRIVYDATMQVDICDLQPADTATDDNGIVWTVLTVSRIESFGFDHLSVRLRRVEGATP